MIPTKGIAKFEKKTGMDNKNICFFETDNEESLLKAILEVEHKPLLENEEKKLISLDYRAKKILSLLE